MLPQNVCNLFFGLRRSARRGVEAGRAISDMMRIDAGDRCGVRPAGIPHRKISHALLRVTHANWLT